MDEKVRENFEKISNGMSRRRFLKSVGKGVFATLTALALGQFEMREVFAGGLLCCEGTLCGGCPMSSGNCPSGKVVCKVNDDDGCLDDYCIYASGAWGCTWQGNEVICYDCWTNGNCGSRCTCPIDGGITLSDN